MCRPAFKPSATAILVRSATGAACEGPGFAGLDMGLSKRWSIDESKGVQFRWEVFNVPNLKRFNVQRLTANIDAGPGFGNFAGLLTSPRLM